MPIAITRDVSPAINECELTHLLREPIDVERACAEHREYERALVALGCRVHQMPADPALPDSVFVEDTAVVFPEMAVLMRPGAESRRRETDAVERRLSGYRRLSRILPPATIDGGDVLTIGRTVFVGRSTRTDEAAIAQLESILRPFGYAVVPVDVCGCLHLKSAVTEVAAGVVLLNPRWLDAAPLAAFERIDVDPEEAAAANALRIGDRVIYPAAFPRTRQRLESRGIAVHVVDVSELAKAEGAVTCCCLIV